MKTLQVKIEDGRYSGMRLDKYVADELGLFSRSQVKQHNLIARVDGKEVKLSRPVQAGMVIDLQYDEPEPPQFSPEDIELDILFENHDVIVVNKPQGMVVHPANGNTSGTLVQGLLHHCRQISLNFGEESLRPGIVHRLDKDTSGVIVAAKHPEALAFLSRQFEARKTGKTYYAVVKGVLRPRSGVVSGQIARDPSQRKRFTIAENRGKSARTVYHALKSWDGYTLVRLKPETGRTHQLRVHMQATGCPILGDPVYARKDKGFPDASLMLHAFSLKILLPGEDSARTFTAPLPEHFRVLLRELAGNA